MTDVRAAVGLCIAHDDGSISWALAGDCILWFATNPHDVSMVTDDRLGRVATHERARYRSRGRIHGSVEHETLVASEWAALERGDWGAAWPDVSAADGVIGGRRHHAQRAWLATDGVLQLIDDPDRMSPGDLDHAMELLPTLDAHALRDDIAIVSLDHRDR